MRYRTVSIAVVFVMIAILVGCAGQKALREQVEEEAEVATVEDSLAQARQDSVEAAEAERRSIEEELLRAEEEARRLEAEAKTSISTVYFDFDKSNLKADVRELLQSNADVLMRYTSWKATIEGHCDERGSTEYNLALGERRAAAVQQYYVDYGVDPGRLKIISYGEEHPAVVGTGEEVWSKNRRGETIVP